MNLNLKKLNLTFDADHHRYVLNDTWIPGTTSISGMLPKEWLAPWVAKTTVTSIKEYWKPDRIYTQQEIDDYLYLGKTAHLRTKTQAADKGTEAHQWFETAISTGTDPDMPRDKHVANAIEQFKQWRSEHDIQWLASEVVVASEQHMFAGTCDALAVIDGKMCLSDFKTSSGIFPEYYIQTAGYQICLEEMGAPPIDERWILRFPKTGNEFEARKVPTRFEQDKKIFLAALEMYRWVRKVEKAEKE